MSKMLYESTPKRYENVEFGEYGVEVLGDPTKSPWVPLDERFPCPCPNCVFYREHGSDSGR